MKQIIESILMILLLACVLPDRAMATERESFAVGKNTFLLNGKPFVVKAAEVHYPRIPRPYWEHRIKMCKALGMNTHSAFMSSGIYTNKRRACMTSRARTM